MNAGISAIASITIPATKTSPKYGRNANLATDRISFMTKYPISSEVKSAMQSIRMAYHGLMAKDPPNEGNWKIKTGFAKQTLCKQSTKRHAKNTILVFMRSSQSNAT
jgi:hypothetical protein